MKAHVIFWANVVLGGVLTALLAWIAKDAPAGWAVMTSVLMPYATLILTVVLNTDKNPFQKLVEGLKNALLANFVLNVSTLVILLSCCAAAGLWLQHKNNAPQGAYRLVIHKGPVHVTGLTVVFKVLDPAQRKGQREVATDLDGMAAFPARSGDLLTIRVQDTEGRFTMVEPAVTLTAEMLKQAHPFDIAQVKDGDWTKPTADAPVGAPVGFVRAEALGGRIVQPTRTYGATTGLARLAPLGRLPVAEALVIRDTYVVGYDPRIRQARWVAYEIRPRAEGVRRKGNVTADPLAPRSVQATNADYAGSGFDRGGLVRPSDVATSQDNMDSALHFTVTTPQRPDLNRRLWAWIEDYSTDQRAPDGSNRVFVIRGPAYLESGAPARGRYLTIGVNRIPVPTHFFEILAVQKAGGPLTLECFMAPNVDRAWDGRQAAIDTHRVSRVAIERATGLKFFGDRHVSESACR